MELQPRTLADDFEKAQRKRDLVALDGMISTYPELLYIQDLVDGGNMLHFFTQDLVHSRIAWTLSKGIDIHSRDKEGCAALHVAARMDDGDTIDFLVAQGADTETPNDAGETPLLYAAKYGAEMSFEHLINSGANYKKLDNEGRSAVFIFAVSRHHIDNDQTFAMAERFLDMFKEDPEWGLACAKELVSDPRGMAAAKRALPEFATSLEALCLREEQPDPIVSSRPPQRSRL